MVKEQTTQMYDTATNLYLGWVDASLNANERFARIARTWIDEALGAQQDAAGAFKQAIEQTQSAITPAEGETPLTAAGRLGEIARTNYAAWTEAAFKAQERFTRVAQTAFEELRTVQTDITTKATAKA